jgi:putative endonuclease
MDACRFGVPPTATLRARVGQDDVRTTWFAHNDAMGRLGEEVAARYLLASGYRVVARNWRCEEPELRGELDIIAWRRRLLVVCEVKTRDSRGWPDPSEAVTPDKAVRLRLLAHRWRRDQRERPARRGVDAQWMPRGLRVDVIAVSLTPRQFRLDRRALWPGVAFAPALHAEVRHLRGVC